MRTKGQAAMEFLMTYGWAILAAVIVIGVLASFGVFSPSKYVPTSCVLSAPFGCDKNQVAANTTDIQLVIRNGGGESMNVSNVSISGCGSNTNAGDGWVMIDQDTEPIIISCTPALITSEKFRGDMAITYRPIGGTLDLTSSGSVVVKVA